MYCFLTLSSQLCISIHLVTIKTCLEKRVVFILDNSYTYHAFTIHYHLKLSIHFFSSSAYAAGILFFYAFLKCQLSAMLWPFLLVRLFKTIPTNGLNGYERAQAGNVTQNIHPPLKQSTLIQTRTCYQSCINN